MKKEISDFLQKNRVGVLTTLLSDGSPHSSALHYSYRIDPLEFYFSVDKTSRKCQELLNKKEGKAAVVIGFSEVDWLTLQMEGLIQILTNRDEISGAKGIHYTKHPNSKKFENDPNTIFLRFKPTWLRYSNLFVVPPEIILLENP